MKRGESPNSMLFSVANDNINPSCDFCSKSSLGLSITSHGILQFSSRERKHQYSQC